MSESFEHWWKPTSYGMELRANYRVVAEAAFLAGQQSVPVSKPKRLTVEEIRYIMFNNENDAHEFDFEAIARQIEEVSAAPAAGPAERQSEWCKAVSPINGLKCELPSNHLAAHRYGVHIWYETAPPATSAPAEGAQALYAFADKLEAAIRARDFRDDWGPFDVQRSCSEMVHEQLDEFISARPATVAPAEPFQKRVRQWTLDCFGQAIADDKVERNHRFLEESLELVQTLGCTPSEAHQLVDYVFGRPQGVALQECGGVLVTLMALCNANGLTADLCGEIELKRVYKKIEQIRAKQAAKPKHSPLSEPAPPSTPKVPGSVEQSAVLGHNEEGPFILSQNAESAHSLHERERFREWWAKQAGVESKTAYQRIQQAFYAGASLAAAKPACPICNKEVSYGISWCKTCDVTHAVRSVECHPCGYINSAPCQLQPAPPPATVAPAEPPTDLLKEGGVSIGPHITGSCPADLCTGQESGEHRADSKITSVENLLKELESLRDNWRECSSNPDVHIQVRNNTAECADELDAILTRVKEGK